MVVMVLFPAGAAVVGPRLITPPSVTVEIQPPTGRRLLKAQKNALNPGLENLRRLRGYFDEAGGNRDRIVARAARLIQSLSAHEEGADAVLRVAAVASLALRTGNMSDVPFDRAYRLPRGAIGWDFGAEGAPVHAGFTPIAPDGVTLNGDFPPESVTIPGTTAISDGINGLDSFESSLPNGLYRILIVAEPSGAGNLGDSPSPTEFPLTARRCAWLDRARRPDAFRDSGIAAATGWFRRVRWPCGKPRWGSASKDGPSSRRAACASNSRVCGGGARSPR
jgi:hypothetical protein